MRAKGYAGYGNKVLKVGLTGGIACGKTTVGEMFVRCGAELVQADRIAHDLMRPGTEVYRRVVCAFGEGILNADGNISRPKLADIAFKGGRIKELDQIVHPAVIAEQEVWMARVRREHKNAVVIVEAALILEAGVQNRFDKLVVVTCLPEQRARRYAQRHGLDLKQAQQEVQRRMRAQLPDEEKLRAADYVIDNSGNIEKTERQVERLYAELKRLALSR